MKLEDIRGVAPAELAKMASDAREELFKHRFAAVAESVENTKKMRELRKRIARIKTIEREHSLAAKG